MAQFVQTDICKGMDPVDVIFLGTSFVSTKMTSMQLRPLGKNEWLGCNGRWKRAIWSKDWVTDRGHALARPLEVIYCRHDQMQFVSHSVNCNAWIVHLRREATRVRDRACLWASLVLSNLGLVHLPHDLDVIVVSILNGCQRDSRLANGAWNLAAPMDQAFCHPLPYCLVAERLILNGIADILLSVQAHKYGTTIGLGNNFVNASTGLI